MKLLNKVKDIILTYKTNILIGILILLSIISIIFQNINDKNKIEINGNEIQTNKFENEIAVYITGEVKQPGVYYIENGLRLNDLIEVCGGLTDKADLSDINLAEKLNDSDKIDIPSIIVEKDEMNSISDIDNNNDLININTASKEELKTLNGIGDTLANNIIEYRNNCKFDTIEDILNVNGIGESKYDGIKEYICVD
ncbi:MAG: helix-hairpin-helix domain-containing protein [Clostridia bacterium]